MKTFYYLVVSYDISDLELCEDSELNGPFEDRETLDKAVQEDLEGRDLETGEVVNVTLLECNTLGLRKIKSFIPSEDENDG